MAWTEFTRRRYERSGGKYASDATAAEWGLVAPLMPTVRRIGGPRTTNLRDVWWCLESGGNCAAAFSEHGDLGLIRRPGQG